MSKEIKKEFGWVLDTLEKVYKDAKDNPDIMAIGVYGYTQSDIDSLRKEFDLKNGNSE